MRTQLISVIKELSFEGYCRQLQMIADRVEAFRARGAARTKWCVRSTQTTNLNHIAYIPSPPANLVLNAANPSDTMD
jgi:hypothetical protein